MMDQAGRASVVAWRELDALLAGPALEAAQRVEAWTAGRRLSARLLQPTLIEDLADYRLKRLTPAPSQVRADRDDAMARERTLQTARLSVGLLELDAIGDTKTLQDVLQRAAGGDEKAQAEIARRLKAAWQEAAEAPRR
jgi:hypothetical protein